MGDLHRYAYCTSRIQPIGNPNSCPKKRDLLDGELVSMKRSRIDQRDSAYGDVSLPSTKSGKRLRCDVADWYRTPRRLAKPAQPTATATPATTSGTSAPIAPL